MFSDYEFTVVLLCSAESHTWYIIDAGIALLLTTDIVENSPKDIASDHSWRSKIGILYRRRVQESTTTPRAGPDCSVPSVARALLRLRGILNPVYPVDEASNSQNHHFHWTIQKTYVATKHSLHEKTCSNTYGDSQDQLCNEIWNRSKLISQSKWYNSEDLPYMTPASCKLHPRHACYQSACPECTSQKLDRASA